MELGKGLLNKMSYLLNNPKITFNQAFSIVYPNIVCDNLKELRKYEDVSIILRPNPYINVTESNEDTQIVNVYTSSNLSNILINGKIYFDDQTENIW